MAQPWRVCVVTHYLRGGGGTASMAAFLHGVLNSSRRYHAEIISLATAAGDPASLRLLAPRTWRGSPRVVADEWHGLPFLHVGAYLPEFEFQRYRPRQLLEVILQRYDLVQFATGVPAWACAARRQSGRPLALWSATTVTADRMSRLRQARGFRRVWLTLMTRIAKRREQDALQRVDRVFALSTYTFDQLRGRVPRGRLVLAPCGVDATWFRPKEGTKPGYVLSVGRFSDPRKNVRLLFDAYASLMRRVTSAPPLVLVGTPPSGSDLRYAASRGLESLVHCLGEVPGDRLVELYQEADVVVMSSDEEGLGIPLIEAMACGAPVVSTRCGGPETSVTDGETGFLIPIGNAEAMAEAIACLIEDPGLRDQFGKAARVAAEERFALPVAGAVFLSQYDALLAGH